MHDIMILHLYNLQTFMVQWETVIFIKNFKIIIKTLKLL